MADKKRAQKISHVETKRYDDPTTNFELATNGRLKDTRLVNRIIAGRKVKPCGRECREYGLMIASNLNHCSFANFDELMNDENFILEIARITPNPVECENYFYQYINSYILRKPDFRLKFLKQIYLNENVYTLKDINAIVEMCGLQEENQTVLNDLSFKRQIENRLLSVDYREKIEYNCSGDNKKELHDYKVNANNLKVLCENVKKGLQEIVDSFNVKEKVEEPQDYYSFLIASLKN